MPQKQNMLFRYSLGWWTRVQRVSQELFVLVVFQRFWSHEAALHTPLAKEAQNNRADFIELQKLDKARARHEAALRTPLAKEAQNNRADFI